MLDRPNTPVLVGAVPLFAVSNITLNEGYQVARISGSSLAQLVAPTTKTISIEAVLVEDDRLFVKKKLEAMALVSRALVAAAAPLMRLAGIPVVCGLTVSTDMQITGLRFTQSNQKRDAIDVSITLEHVPRSSAAELLGELADIDLAAGAKAVATVGAAASVGRQLGLPI